MGEGILDRRNAAWHALPADEALTRLHSSAKRDGRKVSL